MNGAAPDAERFLALAAGVQQADPLLSPIQAGLLAAVHLGIAGDSRTFSRLLGLAHALVLRELNALAARDDRLRIDRRDDRTMRVYFSTGGDAARFFSEAGLPDA